MSAGKLRTMAAGVDPRYCSVPPPEGRRHYLSRCHGWVRSSGAVLVCGTSVRSVPVLAAPWGWLTGRVAVTAWLEGLGSPPCKGEVIASLLHPAVGCHPCPSSIGTGSGCLLFLVFLGLPQTLPGVSPPGVPPRCMMVRNRGVKERRGLGGSGAWSLWCPARPVEPALSVKKKKTADNPG